MIIKYDRVQIDTSTQMQSDIKDYNSSKLIYFIAFRVHCVDMRRTTFKLFYSLKREHTSVSVLLSRPKNR
jgi:quinolinate synthase